MTAGVLTFLGAAGTVTGSKFLYEEESDELIGWLAAAAEPPQAVYVVHGEPDARQALADRISNELGWLAVAPQHLERIRLW